MIARVNNCSLMAQRLTLLRVQPDGTHLRGPTATGCYWLDDSIWYLVTNWHNLTGCNPLTGMSLSPNTGFLPTHVEISLLLISEEDPNIKEWQSRIASLYQEDGEPKWYEHPRHSKNVDVVALPLFDQRTTSMRFASIPINTQEWFKLRLQPGDDAFVLGFPYNLDGGNHLPLWKRASIASEPGLDHGGLPRLLIDTATRKGMSGSPVIAVSNGWNLPQGGKMDDSVFGRVEAFLGIYSGRLDDDKLGVQIGMVWKAPVVADIIQGKMRGHNPLLGQQSATGDP